MAIEHSGCRRGAKRCMGAPRGNDFACAPLGAGGRQTLAEPGQSPGTSVPTAHGTDSSWHWPGRGGATVKMLWRYGRHERRGHTTDRGTKGSESGSSGRPPRPGKARACTAVRTPHLQPPHRLSQ